MAFFVYMNCNVAEKISRIQKNSSVQNLLLAKVKKLAIINDEGNAAM